MKRLIQFSRCLLCLLLIPVSGAIVSAQEEEQITEVPVVMLRQSVAVFNFENRAAGPPLVGRGMADMLVTALVNSERFTVVERQEIDSVLEEQGLGMAGALTEASAAEVGQLLGVELAVYGQVTHFSEERRSVGIRNLEVGRSRARVDIDVRFVNTTTGEIIFAKSFEGAESGLGVVLDTETIDFNSFDSWVGTRIGKAARQSANKAVREAVRQLSERPWHGTLISVASDPYCYIKPGSKSGLQRGNILYVYRQGEALIDPDTGLSLGSEETRVGKIQVLDATIGEGQASKCLIIEGSGLSRGDLIKTG